MIKRFLSALRYNYYYYYVYRGCIRATRLLINMQRALYNELLSSRIYGNKLMLYEYDINNNYYTRRTIECKMHSIYE